MKLYEFQGKEIFKEYGIPVQSGILIHANDEVKNLTPPLVLKAQLLVGGRGKAGGIKIWDGNIDVSKIINELFALTIKREKVNAILALEKVDISREIYISITFNRGKSTPVLIVGTSGGMDIEESAKLNKEKIYFIEFDPFLGILEYQIRFIAKKINIKNYLEFKRIIKAMYKIFKEYDAILVEINPLAITPNGLVAIDSKINLDDQSYFRHEELFQRLKKEKELIQGKDSDIFKTTDDTITFVPLSGNIGLISDGAGTGLLALDLINDFGGKVASFCELGGITNSEIMFKALKMVAGDPMIKSIVVVLIGGFNRMDDMAEGIIKFKKEVKNDMPIFIRMCGTKEEIGKQLIRNENIPVYDSLNEAVEEAVKKARGN
ncbi:MAG: succinate--CoA ligase subunit beta [Candidatus Atribacteria bacterium]|nr:succinate--CoA ligase subunit beta [Candidatus Atribacteria bacterium]